MKIKLTHPNAKIPTRATEGSGGYDIYMPELGNYNPSLRQEKISLGFAAEVPHRHVAMIFPRSGVGFNYQLELNNTVGIIDSDYRGTWFVRVRTKDGSSFTWAAGDKLFQFCIVPVATPMLEIVDSLDETVRGDGGLGSTGR